MFDFLRKNFDFFALPEVLSFWLPGRLVADLRGKNLLSHVFNDLEDFVENIGFEPITSSLPAKRSSQMS